MFKLALLNNRYPALHGLRVLAVLLIVQVHMTSTASFRDYPLGESLSWYSQAMWPGMDFFFVLSGFLIGTMLLHSLGQSTQMNIGRFYARRAFRIFPLYYVCLLLISQLPQSIVRATATGVHPHHDGIRWREWVYLTNYPMEFKNVMYWSWSLSVEEHFYLLVPFLLLGLQRIAKPRNRLKFLAGLWLSCAVVKAATIYKMWDVLPTSFFNFIYFPTHTRYDALIAGIFVAYLHHLWPEELGQFFRTTKGRALAWSLTAGVFLLSTSQFSVSELAFRERLYYVKGAFIVGTPTSLAFGTLILWAVYDGGKFLGHPVFHRIGTLSYGIYLVHLPVIEVFIFPFVLSKALKAGLGFSTAWVLGLAACIPTVILVAYVLHLLVEKPMLQLREKVAPSKSPGSPEPKRPKADPDPQEKDSQAEGMSDEKAP